MNMAAPRALCSAVGHLERAALEPSHWPTALSAMGEALGARIFALLRLGEAGAEVLLPAHAGEHVDAYAQGDWFGRDPRGRRALTMRPDRITNDDEILAEGERETSDFYRDFAARQDVPYVASWRVGASQSPLFFSAMRAANAGPATFADRRRLASIRAHANAAAVLSSHLEKARFNGVLDGFDAAGKAVIALDRHGRAVAATARALPLLHQHFVETQGRLSTTDAFGDAQIRRALERGGEPAKAFLLPSTTGRGAVCTPIRNMSETAVFAEVGALLHLADLSQAPAPDLTMLAVAFDLTPAEAEIAALIGAGQSVEEIARDRGGAVATVRTILASVFRKTGARRQGELVHLLSRLG